MPMAFDNAALTGVGSCGCHQQTLAGFVEDVGGLPEGALSFVNFENMTFYTPEGTDDISDVFVSDPDWYGTLDPDNIVMGVGLVGSNFESNGAFAGTLLSQILSGFTAVLDLTADDIDVDTLAVVWFDLNDSVDFSANYNLELNMVSSFKNSSLTADAFADPAPGKLLAGAHKIALTFAQGVAKVCIDGGSVRTATATSDFSAFNIAGFGFGPPCAAMRSMVVYPVQSSASMQALSALS